ncbi:penicillin-binding transpeptidase domain-containing protein [Pajaroellobacter abortibovis]|uniref:Peptidoglycan glycosyltransferase n=1 Tax=Pajaroellobacter abortibovis TaxID=1882918 RepID=A0A1L6MVY9_9BACT|nr:penicillin-binding transpeptidase domain-containing protein [Pajaroellobacter abortibovis]APR99681.1 peptidoglycan glycosyltransferase [Pajaroellobacter abortibovis]
MKNLEGVRARWIRVRMGIICAMMGAVLAVVVSTAYKVQVKNGLVWRRMAEKQRLRRLHIEPKRGTIFDRNGVVLGISVEVPSVSVDVVEMLRGLREGGDSEEESLRQISDQLASILSLNPDELFHKLSAKPRFSWLKRRVTSEELVAIRELSDPKKRANPLRGLSIEGEGQRYYPNRQLAGPLLGFVAPDGEGKDGIELSLNQELKGCLEEVKGLRDRGGRLLLSEVALNQHAFQGHDIYLAIDQGMQHIAEKELEAAQKTYEAKWAALVMVEPRTGEILALASTPGYNPNDYNLSSVEVRRHRAITDRFEPGSVVKPFVMAGALAAGVIQPYESIYCEEGSYQVGPVIFHDTHPHDWLTPTQILARSSNIGILKIGMQWGEAGVYSILRKFGFGELTGITLPGEVAGSLRPRGRPWYEIETATASFGQGISSTTIQLAMAFAALVNRGRLLEPFLIRKIVDAQGKIVKEGTTRLRAEVVPEDVAQKVIHMLTSVTSRGGTGVEAAIPGFHVPGKTGTAQKADSSTGKYSLNKYTSSFVGSVPEEHARFVIAVVLEEPMMGRYGGNVAGPVFRRVAEAGLRYLGVAAEGISTRLPVYRKRAAVEEAEEVLENTREVPPFEGLSVSPQALADVSDEKEWIQVPDIHFKGAREAVQRVTEAGLVPHLEGAGKVVYQEPPADTLVLKGTTVYFKLEVR